MSDLNWSLISDSCHRKLPTLTRVFKQLFKIALLESRGALPGTRVSTEWSLQAQNKPEGPKTQDKPYHVYSYNLTPLDVGSQAGRKRGDPQPFPLQHGDALGTDVLTLVQTRPHHSCEGVAGWPTASRSSYPSYADRLSCHEGSAPQSCYYCKYSE